MNNRLSEQIKIPIKSEWEISEREDRVFSRYIKLGIPAMFFLYFYIHFCAVVLIVKCLKGVPLSTNLLFHLPYLLILLCVDIFVVPPIVIIIARVIREKSKPMGEEYKAATKVLGAALFGVSRINKKTGRPELCLKKPEELFKEGKPKEALVQHCKDKLDYFLKQENVEKKYRLIYNVIFFEALAESGVVEGKFLYQNGKKIRPAIISKFLSLLGNDYSYSDQEFQQDTVVDLKKKNVFINTHERFGTWEFFKKIYKNDIKQLIGN